MGWQAALNDCGATAGSGVRARLAHVQDQTIHDMITSMGGGWIGLKTFTVDAIDIPIDWRWIEDLTTATACPMFVPPIYNTADANEDCMYHTGSSGIWEDASCTFSTVDAWVCEFMPSKLNM